MTDRNRADGWKHAKLSGHQNEELVAELTRTNSIVQSRLLQCAHMTGSSIISIEYGGLCEQNVPCIFSGESTKSKTDMWLHLTNGVRLNVSIKKDEGGQVFLIGIDRFIRGFETQYHCIIPDDVKRAIRLYFGSANDTMDIINKIDGPNCNFERRKHRLVADTLCAYNPHLASVLICWINNNINELFDFCFSKGLAKRQEDWADIVWYINLVGENSFDTMINLRDMTRNINQTAKYGSRNGGSTIQLPFGFVQWHSPLKKIPGNLQFHHSYEKIITIL